MSSTTSLIASLAVLATGLLVGGIFVALYIVPRVWQRFTARRAMHDIELHNVNTVAGGYIEFAIPRSAEEPRLPTTSFPESHRRPCTCTDEEHARMGWVRLDFRTKAKTNEPNSTLV